MSAPRAAAQLLRMLCRSNIPPATAREGMARRAIPTIARNSQRISNLHKPQAPGCLRLVGKRRRAQDKFLLAQLLPHKCGVPQSHGITKPEAPAERHRNEYVARWGFSSFGVGGYNHVAPTELRNGSSVAARTAALRQQQWGWGEGERSKLQPQAHEDSRTCQTWRVPRQRLGVSQLDYDPRAVEAERGEFTGVMR